MSAVNLSAEIRRYRKQREKIEAEIRGLEKKKEDQTARIDLQIGVKQAQIASIDKCLNKVARLQKQIAETLGVDQKEEIQAEPSVEKEAPVERNVSMEETELKVPDECSEISPERLRYLNEWISCFEPNADMKE